VLFWSASLFFLERALLQGRAGAWWGAGLSLGLGLLSKYTIALLGPAALLFVLVDRPSRRWLRRFEPWAAAALAALLFTPVLVWNLQNQWASFRFQSVRRMQMAWEFGLPELLLDCALLVTPAVLLAVGLELWGRERGAENPTGARRRRFLGIFLGVPLSVFVAYSIQHRATFHWTGPIWLAALPLAARSMGRAGGSRWQRGLRRSWGPLLAGLCVAAGVGVHALVFQVPRLPHTQLSDRYYWSDAAPVLGEVGRELAERTGRRPLFVGMSRWAVASSLAFYAPSGDPDDVTSRHLFGRSGGMYERWLPPERARGRPVVLVAWQRKSLTGGDIRRRIEGLGPIRRLPIRREGRILRQVYVRTGLRYRGR
jgi:dolichol-phosphate mannosyltransferase